MSELPILLAAFYKFFDFPDYEEHRAALRQRMLDGDIKGTLLLSPEGVNSTISGPPEAVRAFIAHLRTDPRMADMEHKESFFTRHPFTRALVRLKKEIMGLGAPVNVHEKVGTYIEPKDWNGLIEQEDVYVLDTRNTYETHLGTFKGAVDPRIHHFKELPDFVREEMDTKKHKRVATFCTGGIRCEKFTAYLLDQGFEEVYHLKGGILKYLEEVPQEQSTWEGECFVFDHRVGVGHGLEPSKAASACYGCGHSLLPQDREHPDYIPNERCPYCEETKKARIAAAKAAL
ncbi:MAG: rhodanese-related sulfurtransferase [Alphaproteobacteria bacterium]|nr:rhodanese-related sulfurtransferase [Alphaproteobacteria bacterium]